MADVVKFEPVEVGEAYRFEPDIILEDAKGHGLTIVAVIGEDADGDIWITGSANGGETLILMERARRRIVFNE